MLKGQEREVLTTHSPKENVLIKGRKLGKHLKPEPQTTVKNT